MRAEWKSGYLFVRLTGPEIKHLTSALFQALKQLVKETGYKREAKAVTELQKVLLFAFKAPPLRPAKEVTDENKG
jgi:hypothetical protein